MSLDSPSPRRSKTVIFGFVTALVLASFQLIAFLINPVTTLPVLIVFVLVALGILRGKAWSAYGGALFVLALFAGIVLSTLAADRDPPWQILAVGAVLYGLAAFVLFRAGRSLAPQSMRRGLGWIALATLVFVFPFVYRTFSIPSVGMEATILRGDKVLMRMVGVLSPSRGEIVAFRSPADATLITLKRIVAIGGDKIQLKEKRLFLNAIEQNEPYVVHIDSLIDPFRDNFPQEPSMPLQTPGWAEVLKKNTVGSALVVPSGKFFLMGDNRENSLDSRYIGFIAEKDIVGRPAMVLFSVDAPVETLMSESMPYFALLNPKKIRWNRTLMPLK